MAGCGNDTPTQPVPAASATEASQPPAPATATATATPTARHNLKTEPDSGDEHPIGVPVRVVVSATRIKVVKGATAPAFLPLRVTVVSRLDSAVQIRVIQAGGDGTPLGQGRVAPGATTSFRVKGGQPGSLEILSPDLNPDRTAFVVLKRS